MRERLMRAVPVVAALTLVLAVSTSGGTHSTLAAVGTVLVATAVAAAWAGAVVVAAVARLRVAGRRPGDRRAPLADPAPRHPDTPGRARPRAPGRGLAAA